MSYNPTSHRPHSIFSTLALSPGVVSPLYAEPNATEDERTWPLHLLLLKGILAGPRMRPPILLSAAPPTPCFPPPRPAQPHHRRLREFRNYFHGPYYTPALFIITGYRSYPRRALLSVCLLKPTTRGTLFARFSPPSALLCSKLARYWRYNLVQPWTGLSQGLP